ncbi:unnamed protein product [Prorocentrum cordatum]|uniref:Uncharacterized protein n=1 Tax=Prorocentrum cordatum TaxID=2364126 RepID=A0ABN9UBX4_9DINO|nr:unnamed protein product [Polarella glacialis]
MRAMGPVPGAVGLSYGVGRRDPWSEQLSNLFGVPSRLFGCLAEGGPALLDGVTRNGALSCRGQKGICYEKPYTLFAAACPAGGGGGQRERFLQHLRDQAPLSAHVKMNVEDAEWDLLRGLLGSGEDFEKVRTLDLTVHLSAASAGRQDLEDRVTVLERLAQRFSVVGSTLEYQRELWSPEARCPGSDCPEPAVHLPSMAVDGLSVSLVNRRLVARWRAPSGHRRHAPDVPPTSPPGAEQFVSRVEKPCQRVLGGKSSRPGVPCLPPAQAYPYKSWTRWRLDLGERVAVAVTPTITEAQCGGFSFYGDSTLCNAAMGKAGALALSYGIEERDLWSERMSNIYHLRTKLYDCFIPPARSPPMAGVAPNATGPCQLEGSHCYEQPYEPYRVCLGPEAAPWWNIRAGPPVCWCTGPRLHWSTDHSSAALPWAPWRPSWGILRPSGAVLRPSRPVPMCSTAQRCVVNRIRRVGPLHFLCASALASASAADAP